LRQEDLFRLPRKPWNVGRLIGPKAPLKPKHIWAIRQQLKVTKRVRDLAMFNGALDAKLRACDRLPAMGLAGGEELLNSLDIVPRVDVTNLRDQVVSLGNATAAALCGWWLENASPDLRISKAAVETFRPLAPKQPRYALGAKPGDAKLVPGWKVFLPPSLTDRRFEGT
jgi:hypothetical protein